jgi:hypothetical protein
MMGANITSPCLTICLSIEERVAPTSFQADASLRLHMMLKVAISDGITGTRTTVCTLE